MDIQKIRRQRPIGCGPGGTVHDYVAFYFGPRSPMLLQLHTGRVEDYDEGQEPLIYAVSTVGIITQRGLGFIFPMATVLPPLRNGSTISMILNQPAEIFLRTMRKPWSTQSTVSV
ncbi:DarT ssDNA thymidine ADP-ribosyltransferase family protein [Desulfococcus multivorans]|uniref:DarT ssDNA thymidine ADP-ribosyltransferase family protein n=1 Tax=Desulfococcus multivorans TaxID=897 RepID=UPI00058ECA86